MSAYGKILPQYYDSFMGKELDILLPFKTLLKKFVPSPKNILELGCGTGTILTHMPKNAKVTGIDLSSEMLKIARKKVPSGTFIQADISTFTVKERFDLILCVFDTINHLNSFSQWKRMFSRVAKHLDEKGVFIFDMNSLERFNFAIQYPPYAKYIGKDTIIFKATKEKKNLFDCSFKIFSHQEGNKYRLYEEHIYESGFTIEKVKGELEKYFVIKTIHYERQKKYPASLRVFFVCQKK